MLRIYNTRFTNNVGEEKYPIHLLVSNATRDTDELHFDLQCKYEIYAMAWANIYHESVQDYYDGKLEENMRNYYDEALQILKEADIQRVADLLLRVDELEEEIEELQDGIVLHLEGGECCVSDLKEFMIWLKTTNFIPRKKTYLELLERFYYEKEKNRRKL